MVQSREQKNGSLINQTDGYDLRDASLDDHAGNGKLSKLQKEILLYLEQGYTKHQAAEKMGMSVHTFDGYLREIYRTVDVHTMTAAVAKAIREKLI